MPTCHYEILSIAQDADEKAIKKSYRKLALKYHPDKNQENLEQATEQFRFVQAAYECLSDPQERAWYDDHRDAYIKGFKHTGDSGEKYEEDDTSHLFQYMTSLAFNGFDESENKEKNFYTVYRKLFCSVDEEENGDYRASFGTSKSEWADVNEFYASWEAYVTNKTYGGADHYDTRQAQDRRMRRAMEQENQKVRDECKKKRNAAVRDLVRFVRKRDPRVIARNAYLTEKANQNKLKAEAKKKADLAKRVAEMEEYEKEILKEMEDDKFWEEEDRMGNLDEMWASDDEADKGRRGGKKKKIPRWDHQGRRVNIEGEDADVVINLGEKSEFLVAGNLGEKIAKSAEIGSEDELDTAQKSAIESWLADAKVDDASENSKSEVIKSENSESENSKLNSKTPSDQLDNDVSYYFNSQTKKPERTKQPEKSNVEPTERVEQTEEDVAEFLAKKITVEQRDRNEVACAVKTTIGASFKANTENDDQSKVKLTKKQRNALKKSKLAENDDKDEAVPEKSTLAKKLEKTENPDIDLSILKLSSDDGQDAFSQKTKKKKKKGKR